MARYQQVIKLREQGMTQNAIAQQFAHMLRQRQGEHLDEWLAQVQSSNLPCY